MFFLACFFASFSSSSSSTEQLGLWAVPLTPPSPSVWLVLLSAPGWLVPPPAPGWVLHLVPSVISAQKEPQLSLPDHSVGLCGGQHQSHQSLVVLSISPFLVFIHSPKQDFFFCSCCRFQCQYPVFLYSFPEFSAFKLQFRNFFFFFKSPLPQFSAFGSQQLTPCLES